VASVGAALSGSTSIGIADANAEFGGNVEGLAHLMFTTYLLALQVVAALLISAALGALVLAHRERIGEKLDQTTLANRRVAAFRDGVHPGGMPNPGVLASSNAIGTPALLPDGTPTELSVPVPLRGQKAPEVLNDPELIKAEQSEIEAIADSEAAVRPEGLAGIGGHTDLSDVYPEQLDPDTAGTGETALPPAPEDDPKSGDA
jgi:NADH-quinone oxidoreductase subunit J